ncbi:MAG: TMEM165/GDT1 family protein [Caulobacterales bacterium]
MEAFLISAGLVAVAEIGDKTQLLAILLATRFRKPIPIIAGIFVATIANHALAAWAGSLLSGFLDGKILLWVLAVSFVAMAIWALIPDKDDENAAPVAAGSVFLATTIAFFLVEMGDKTQVATAALGARFENVAVVAAGTTLGMMIANVPAVFLGDTVLKFAPLHLVRYAAAAIFAALAIATILSALAIG